MRRFADGYGTIRLTMPRWLTIGIAVACVSGALLEVFQDLFHPSQRGALSGRIGRGIFSLLRRWPRHLPWAGPVALVAVIGCWLTLVSLGFALIYYGALPQNFRTNTGVLPPATDRFWSAMYFSLEVMTTLGLGDIAPATPTLRLIATAQALIGFALLTASVSWIVLLYPAFGRMRLLARTVSLLVSAEQKMGIKLSDTESELFLATLARDVVRIRVDLVHFPIVYYFASKDKEASVAHALGSLTRFAAEASSPEHSPALRLAAASLDCALNDFAALLLENFLRLAAKDRSTVFRQYATDHLVAE
jgi:Ion channel